MRLSRLLLVLLLSLTFGFSQDNTCNRLYDSLVGHINETLYYADRGMYGSVEEPANEGVKEATQLLDSCKLPPGQQKLIIQVKYRLGRLARYSHVIALYR